MKNLLFILSLSVGAFAAGTVPKTLEIQCVTEFPTTSFIGLPAGDKLQVSLLNHNGAGYMPIHRGLVTINDVELIKKRADVLKSLGRQARFEFDLKNCKVAEDGTFSCFQGGVIKGENGEDFQVSSFSSSKNQLTFSGLSFNQVNLDLALYHKGEPYYVSMVYQDYECGVNYTFGSRFLAK